MGLMPDKREKVIEILSQFGTQSMVNLVEKTGIRRGDLFKLIPEMESDKNITSKKDGRERLVSLSSPIKSTKSFILNYEKQLDHYEKFIEKELKNLEKNKPLVSKTNFPFTKIKIKQPVLELDKEKNIYRDMGKTTEGHAYTFKTRPTARKHFDMLLNTLNRLYQESSALNFADIIIDDDKLLREYQKRSDKLIRNTTKRIEKMFDPEEDLKSRTFITWQLRNVLYGLVFKASLKKEIEN